MPPLHWLSNATSLSLSVCQGNAIQERGRQNVLEPFAMRITPGNALTPTIVIGIEAPQPLRNRE